MRRREFITLLGGAAAAWPLAARAQQGTPLIAYMSSRSAESDAAMLRAFRRGLNEQGFAEGRNLAIEYRFADGDYDRVAVQAEELIGRRVAVIIFGGARAGSDPTWQQLRASQIPVVFNVGLDPVRSGLVASINRPGGNFTGFFTLVGELTGKNLGLLRDLAPGAATVALLADSSGADPLAEGDARKAAAALGLQLVAVHAASDNGIEAAFALLDRQQVDALVVTTNPFYVTRAKQIAAHAARLGVPAIFARREFAEAGGLVSYGYDVGDIYRQMGVYATRILKGDKPADLPVVLPTKFELVINMKTAKALGFQIPDRLVALSDEVIE